MKDYGALIAAAIRSYSDSSDRSVQSDNGILGPSDIGFCRQKAVLMTRGVAATDSTPIMPAAIGTAIHNYTEAAIKEMFPTWLVGSLDKIRVTAVLPSGAEISGHPDIIIPEDNVLLDLKTKDGLAWAKREGASQSNKYQRHLYVLGAINSGLLDKTRPIYVGNAFLDRSGKEELIITDVAEYDPTLTDEIDGWVTDVIYAVKNKEDASRDLPSAVCEKICSHFTACRGGMQMNDGGEQIENPELVAAITMYVEGRDMEKTAAQMKKEASAMLHGVNGATKSWQVRWVDIQPSTVESFEKQGYSRLDIRKVRAR
jgi:hypothetical protein